MMKFSSASISLLLLVSSVSAFAPSSSSSSMIIRSSSSPSSSALNIVVGDTKEAFADRVKSIFKTKKKSTTKSDKFDDIVQLNFPGAITNQELVQKSVSLLSKKGYNGENTLLATSLCCDELARKLEDDFNGIYGKNFNLGGLGTLTLRDDRCFSQVNEWMHELLYCYYDHSYIFYYTTMSVIVLISLSASHSFISHSSSNHNIMQYKYNTI